MRYLGIGLGIYLGIGLFFRIIEILAGVKNPETGAMLKNRFEKELASGEVQLATHGDRVTLYSHDPEKRGEIEDTARTFEKMNQSQLALFIVTLITWPFFIRSYIKLILVYASRLYRKIRS